MAENLAVLAERLGINTMVEFLNREDADDSLKGMDAYRIKLYYDQMMLDKIKISQDNYVYLNYAKKYTLPKGHEKWTIRRSFPLTEHTVPLLEGIPPRSDKTKKERIEGVFHQYGRYMEFSDRVDWKQLDPIIMEYASEYGDVAVRTMHRLARKELLNSTMKVFANDRANIGELEIGDTVGLADFRLVALKLSRLQVRPINGLFPVITSPEHFYDLMDDPLIVAYLGSNQGMPHYKDGSLPDLFGIKFIKTQFDDYTYGYELSNSGEWMDHNDNMRLRVYWVGPDGKYYYTNVDASGNRKVYVAAEYKSDTDTWATNSRSEEEGLGDYSSKEDAADAHNRLSDGSWIPVRTRWHFDAFKVLANSEEITTDPGQDVTSETQLTGSYVYYKYDNSTNVYTIYLREEKDSGDYLEVGTVDTSDRGDDTGKLLKDDLNGILPEVKQLPVHKAMMLGEEALAQLEVTGEGNVQMFAKQKGSAGVLDPIDQRQSIGFKMNTIGFKLVREESCWVFYHVPTQATTTAEIGLK